MSTGKRTASVVEKANFYGELRSIAKERGYSSGWTAHKHKERFGNWPNDWRIKTAAARPPSLATRNWVKSRAIAWAKGRAANG
jgi:DNA repair protein RadD